MWDTYPVFLASGNRIEFLKTQQKMRETQNYIPTKNGSILKSTWLTQTHTKHRKESIPQRPTKREDCSMSKSTQLIKPGKPTCIMALDVKKTYILNWWQLSRVFKTHKTACCVVSRSPYTWSPPQDCPLDHNCTHTACSGLAVMDYMNKNRSEKLLFKKSTIIGTNLGFLVVWV